MSHPKTSKTRAPASQETPRPEYLPFARKYRPQTFQELVGQPHVTETLSRAIETSRIGQAYLFTGQRGVGKTSAARILAKALNCAKGPTPIPCQECPSCVQITQGSSLDVVEIDGASNRGIDEIRSLRETVQYAPTQGRYRIYIIDEVHQITHDGFNALLKTLEEPPAHVRFIFATTSAQRVLPTILSRCQRFDFRRLDGTTIVTALQRITTAERITIDEKALYAIARSSEGSLRDAEVILEQLVSFCEGRIGEQDVTQLLGAVEHDALVTWAQAIFDRDANTALLFLTQQLNQGKDIPQLLVGLLMHLRNLLILRVTTGASARADVLTQLLDVPSEQLGGLEAQAARTTPEELLGMIQLLTGAYELVRRTPFGQTILELTLIKLTTRESWTSLGHIMQRLEQLAGQSTGSGSESPAAPRPVAVAASAPGGAMPAAPSDTPESVEPSQAPVPADPSAMASLEQVSRVWPEVLQRIGQQKMSLAAYLTNAQPVTVSGTRLQIGLPAFALHQEVLATPDNLRIVEQVLGERLTTPLTIEYTVLPDLPTTPSQAGSSQGTEASLDRTPTGEPLPPIVSEIVSLFDAKIVRHAPPQHP